MHTIAIEENTKTNLAFLIRNPSEVKLLNEHSECTLEDIAKLLLSYPISKRIKRISTTVTNVIAVALNEYSTSIKQQLEATPEIKTGFQVRVKQCEQKIRLEIDKHYKQFSSFEMDHLTSSLASDFHHSYHCFMKVIM